MYNEKSKERTMRYMKEKREKLTLNFPLGYKDKYKQFADSQEIEKQGFKYTEEKK